jgi:hypothetical protein
MFHYRPAQLASQAREDCARSSRNVDEFIWPRGVVMARGDLRVAGIRPSLPQLTGQSPNATS